MSNLFGRSQKSRRKYLEFSDFRKLALSDPARHRLGAIAEAQLQHPDSNTKLLRLILANACDPERGFYMGLTDKSNLPGFYTKDKDIENLPNVVSPVEGWHLNQFLNPLLFPVVDFHRPSLRATNGGFLIVTHEFDAKKEQFEETLAWSAPSGRFGELHRELLKYRDYRGYCIVFAGNKSLHFHFLFDTRHLKYAPHNAEFEERLAAQSTYCSIMSTAYIKYWDLIHGLFLQILKPSVESDPALRKFCQWRRTPFGIRILDQRSPILDLAAGARIPQIVIQENIRDRAAKGSGEYFVPEEFSGAIPAPHRERRGLISADHDSAAMFRFAEDLLTTQWGEYPKLASIQQSGNEWVFRFHNHAGDTSPDTVVRGEYKKLVLVGRKAPSGNYFLPDDMTANDFGDYLAMICGQQPLQRADGIDTEEPKSLVMEDVSPPIDRPLPTEKVEALVVLRNRPNQFTAEFRRNRIEQNWALPMRGLPLAQVIDEYRSKLRTAVAQCRDFDGFNSDYIILSGEGIGKTTAHMAFAVGEALFTALDGRVGDQTRRFNVFAFRSLEQASVKAAEAEAQTGCKVVVLQSFWKHYAECCEIEHLVPMHRALFRDWSINGVLKTIRDEQPVVFDRLEAIRAKIWPKHFDAADTLIFTSHPTASSWAFSQLTRIWHHPQFEPFMAVGEQQALRSEFVFNKVIYDEPEVEGILHILPEKLFDHLTEQHDGVNWKDLSVQAKQERFEQARSGGLLGSEMNFESYEELMRIQLDKLDRVEVDCDAIPFGHDNKRNADGEKTGIYRDRHRDAFYLGSKAWLKHDGTHWTFLTTERLVTAVVEEAYRKVSKKLLALRLDNMPDVYPIRIPAFLDPRAGAKNISALAKDILKTQSDAVVADGVKDEIGAMSFQRMKGRNDLADKDVYIILTSLNPEQYARLNVIGQWLGIPDIIELHYQGLINQAVGRNTGFRQQDHTKTVVICSKRLWDQTISRLNSKQPRVVLQEVRQRPW